MLISFVVIAFNEQRNLRDTLTAIFAQLGAISAAQQRAGAALQVVVVNDGSTDDTSAIAHELAARPPSGIEVLVIDQPNGGRGAARAAGVAAAGGELIAFVDGDIVLPPDWLARTLAALQPSTDPGLAEPGSTDRVWAAGGVPVPDGDVAYVHRAFALACKPKPAAVPVTGSNGLFRAEVFDGVGFDPSYRNGEDVALSAAMQAAGMRTRTLTDLLVEHREHKSYRQSLAWLFESGRGATRQLAEQRRVRLPDVVAAGFWGLCGVVAPLLGAGRGGWFAVLLVGYTLAASAALLHGRFRLLAAGVRSGAAIGVQASLLLAYFAGRIAGVPAAWRRRPTGADQGPGTDRESGSLGPRIVPTIASRERFGSE